MTKRGFTLVEMLIVVAIIGVLAVVAGVAYRKYLDAARTTEAYSMLGEIRNREEAYRAEFSSYISTNTQSETALFPAVDSGTCYYGGSSTTGKEPCPKAANAQTGGAPPPGWLNLGINVGRNTLQCGYTAIANNANTAPAGTLGMSFLGSAALTTTWWYAVAVCDNDGVTTTNATFVTAYNTTVVSAQNEHK